MKMKKNLKKALAMSMIGMTLVNSQILSVFAEEIRTTNAGLTMDDNTNVINGLNESHMWSNNGGESWKQGKINQLFRGTQNIRVAMFDQLVVDSKKWQARSYTGGTHVIYEGSIWKNGWWAEPTDIPGFANVWQKVKDLPNPIATFDFTKFNGEEADKYQREEAEKIQNEKKVIGYFSNWHGYKTDYQPQNPDYSTSNGVTNGKGYDPEDVPFDKISHVNYAFMVIDNEGNLKSNDPWADYEADGAKNYINQIVQKAEENDVAAMVSIGGWTNSVDDRGFDHATATPERMNRFTDQLVEFMLKYEFDGIDIDWEYPENNEEKTKFVALLKQLREKMTRAGKEDDQYYQLSIAVTANHQKMEFIAPKIVNEYVDSFNVMTYDFRGGFDSETGHHAPLYSTSTDKDKKFNVSSAMEEYHKVFGIPKNKLMVGMSYYSRGFANVSKAGIGIPSKGTPNGGSWDDPAQLAGLKPWWQLKDYEKQAKDENVKHLSYYWDEEAQAPYIYDAQKKELFTYDNIESISKKVNYTIDNGFGGAIIWELAHDTPETAELTSLAANVLSGNKINIDEEESVKQIISIGGQGISGAGETHKSGFARVNVEVENGVVKLIKNSDYKFHWSAWQASNYVTIKITTSEGEILYNQSWKGNDSVKGNGYQVFDVFEECNLPEDGTVEIYHAEGSYHRFYTSDNDELKTKLGKTGNTYIYTMKNNKLELTDVK